MKKLAFAIIGMMLTGFAANADCPDGKDVASAIKSATSPSDFETAMTKQGVFKKTYIHGFGWASSNKWSDMQKAAEEVTSTFHSNTLCGYNMSSKPANYSISVYLYY